MRVLEETFRRYGQRSEATLQEEIRSLAQMRAEGEYRTASTPLAFLQKLPAFLPVCMARSSPEPTMGEPRCLVGPVVNSAARCGEWSPGAGASPDAESAQLEALVAHVRGIVSQSEAATLMAPWQAPGAMRLQANAEAAIVARCLSMLGASPDHIAAVCNSFTQVFGEPWDQQLSAQIEASAPLVAPSASQFPQTGAPQVGAGPGGSGGSGALGTQPTQMSGAAYEAGQACYHNGDLEAAEARFRQAIELGYTQAAIGLGNVIQDTEEMIRWWRWAAEQGNLVAIDCLIAEYKLGENPDPAEVLRWYRASAAHPDQKHPAEVREAIARCEKELRAPEKAARKLDRLLRDAASGGDWEAIYKAGMKRYEHWEGYAKPPCLERLTCDDACEKPSFA